MSNLWNALVSDKLGPAGHETDWGETPVRIRNRFIQAVRQVLQSGAAFHASTIIGGAAKKIAQRPGKKTTATRADRELMLPLMVNVPAGAKPAKKTRR
jgi:hypothetical protein